MSAAQEHVAAGYFLSRHVGRHDEWVLDLRPVTLASDHTPRKFFPDSWALSWCSASREHRVKEAAVFGIAEQDLDGVTAWADQAFDATFGAWNVFFTLADARAAARTMLEAAAGLELWGLGLRRDLLAAFCRATTPPPPKPGYAPMGASGLHLAACERTAPLAEGGTVLGFDLLIETFGCQLNSPESLHLDEPELWRAVGVVPNANGLLDSFDQALACCRHLDAQAAATQDRLEGWLPWRIVRYPLDGP